MLVPRLSAGRALPKAAHAQSWVVGGSLCHLKFHEGNGRQVKSFPWPLFHTYQACFDFISFSLIILSFSRVSGFLPEVGRAPACHGMKSTGWVFSHFPPGLDSLASPAGLGGWGQGTGATVAGLMA